MAEREEALAVSAAFREAFELAQRWIDEQEFSILANPAQWRKRSRLAMLRREINRRMDDLDAQALAFFSSDFPAVYRLGAESAAGALGIRFSWSQLDLDAVTILARQSYDDLLRATTGVRESTKALIRRLVRERALLSATVGQTATQAGRDLRKLLERNGIRAVVYRNGAKLSIGDYSDMVIRSVTATAMNTGTLNQGVRAGVQYVEVFDGTGDPLCAPYANTIQPIEWALANPIGHPRCVRAFGNRPDVESVQQARSAELSTTAAQRADQVASEQARADANRRRAQRRAAQRRADARSVSP